MFNVRNYPERNPFPYMGLENYGSLANVGNPFRGLPSLQSEEDSYLEVQGHLGPDYHGSLASVGNPFRGLPSLQSEEDPEPGSSCSENHKSSAEASLLRPDLRRLRVKGITDIKPTDWTLD